MGWLTRILVVVTMFLAIGIISSLETFRSNSDGLYSPKLSFYIKLVHLLSFSTTWGACLWAIFVGGFIMFKNLPRYQFGHLRSKVFPAYFAMAGGCSAISLGAFGYLHPYKSSSTIEKYQLGVLLSAFTFNLSNLILFTPMTIKVCHVCFFLGHHRAAFLLGSVIVGFVRPLGLLGSDIMWKHLTQNQLMMKKRHKVEREHNIEDKVMRLKNKEGSSKVNANLTSMNIKFRMIHGFASLSVMLTLGSLFMHLWYLAGKFSL